MIPKDRGEGGTYPSQLVNTPRVNQAGISGFAKDLEALPQSGDVSAVTALPLCLRDVARRRGDSFVGADDAGLST